MAQYLSYSNDAVLARADVKTATAAATLTPANSGTTYILDAAAGAEIALPSDLESGVQFRFIVGSAFATTDWTIISSTNIIQGNVLVAGAHVAGSDENTISFVASAESVGDYVDVVCDGTNYYVSGSGVTSGSITLTAA